MYSRLGASAGIVVRIETAEPSRSNVVARNYCLVDERFELTSFLFFFSDCEILSREDSSGSGKFERQRGRTSLMTAMNKFPIQTVERQMSTIRVLRVVQQ